MHKESGAARPLVSVADVKTHLRIEGNDEDTHLECLLLAAQDAAANFCLTDFSGKLPDTVRLAILLYVGHFHTYRESGDGSAHAAMLSAFHSLLWPYRNAKNLF